ncbi:MAG: Spy/CpxP family protein refolding chaperone, partial [Gemmatimonadaceae bacterium]|nr:Spy/CpxP family protein refolding chaperone [Gemmatimonadaceae bacterium]
PGGLPGTGARGAARGLGAGLNPDDPRRAALEKRLQERLLVVVRQRLNLTDEQVTRLQDVASKTEYERRALRRDELTARFAMRQELLAGDKANEAKVADLLEQLPRLERRRVDLMEREQRELAKFLSPLQRARYFGLQDELRRGMQELQQQRLAAPDSAGAGRNGLGGGLRRNRLRPPPR